MTSPDMVNDGTVEANRIGARFASKALEVGKPSMTTKSRCVNFPFPSNLVIAIPFWGSTTPGPGRSWPEMV